MDNVLTVVAAEPGGAGAAVAADFADALSDLGGEPQAPVWLAAERAFDLPFAGIDAGAAGHGLAALRRDRAVDMAAQAAATRRKRLLVADMDSTVIAGESLDDLAERAMRGEVAFRDALIERVAMLEGLDAGLLETVAEGLRPTAGAAVLVNTMKAHGAKTALVSGGLGFFTGRVRRLLGFDFDKGNDIEIVGGRLTGRVKGPIVSKDVKRHILVDLASWNAIPLARTLAVGDSANDVPMIERAGLGVAYRGKPALRCAADATLDACDLGALLFFQGYRAHEFVD